MFKTILTNIFLILSVCLGWVLLSLIFSVYTHSLVWFSRSGSILTLGGAALAIRPLLRLGTKEFFNAQRNIDCGHFIPTKEEKEKEEQEFRDVQASNIGFWFIVIGTIIWGYGDVLQAVIFPISCK